MSSVISRPARLLVVAASSAFLLSGCGSGPSQVGAAAIVGDQRVEVNEIKSSYDALLKKEPQLKDQLKDPAAAAEMHQKIATFAVLDEVARAAITDEHLPIADQQVNAAVGAQGGPEKATEGTIFNAGQAGAKVRLEKVTTELGKKYTDRLSVVADYTQADSREKAEAKGKRMLAGPDQAKAVVAEDRGHGLAAEAGKKIQALEINEQAEMFPVFGTDVGAVAVFQSINDPNKWLVARVDHRDMALGSGGQTEDPKLLNAVGKEVLAMHAERVGVDLNPRYGEWDPIQLQAVAKEKSKGLVLSPGSGQA